MFGRANLDDGKIESRNKKEEQGALKEWKNREVETTPEEMQKDDSELEEAD